MVTRFECLRKPEKRFSHELYTKIKKEYNERIVAALKEEFSYSNVMQVPRLNKIVVSRGVGAAVADKKLIDHAVDELTRITGQRLFLACLRRMSLRSSYVRGCLLVPKLL